MSCCIPPRNLIGYGAFLQMWDNAVEEWVIIGGTSDLEVPELTREFIETNADDGDGTVHYIGVPQTDLGAVTYTVDFIESQHTRLHNLAQQNPPYNTCWRVVLNTPQQRYFKWCGGISALTVAIPKKELVTADLTIHTTGGGLATGVLADE